MGYFSYYQQGRKQAWETTVLGVLMELLLLPGLCPDSVVGWVLTETHPREKSLQPLKAFC